MHQVTVVCPSPQPWHWERGMSPVCGHAHQDRQGSACPQHTGNQHTGSSSLQWRSLCSISDPDLNSAPCVREVQAELLGCVMLLPHTGNWVSSWRAVCLCCVTCFLHKREMLDFCTSVCPCSVHSPLDQRIKSNTGVLTLTERQNFSLQSLFPPPMESGKSYLQNILLSMNDFISCLCVTKSVKCMTC